ncbi:MAG TPA: hypothetical protein VEW95_05570 [Candidatus Limnocylindrales bacterium]|nr:hypothetical protein [Candidatus Limnocylindrales bacterium]
MTRQPNKDLGPIPPEPMIRSRLTALLDSMNDLEKVLYPGLVLLAIGFALSPLPYLGLIVPGAVIVYIALRADPTALAELSELEEGT